MVAKHPEGGNKVMAMQEVLVHMPDFISESGYAEVTKVLVSVGDVVSADQALITVESDQVVIDVPSPAAGMVCDIVVARGDKLPTGVPILVILQGEPSTHAAVSRFTKALDDAVYDKKLRASEVATMVAKKAEGENKGGATHEIQMPSFVGLEGVEVTKVLVSQGDVVNKDQALITVSSNKTPVDIRAPAAGTVCEMEVKPGDKVFITSPILTIKLSQGRPAKKVQDVVASPPPAAPAPAPAPIAPPAPVAPVHSAAAAARMQHPARPANQAALNWLAKVKANDVFYRKPQAPAQRQHGLIDPFKGRELRLEFIAGSLSGKARQPIRKAPAVRLTAGGRPVARARIDFNVSEGDLGGGATTARSVTNALGVARLPPWTLGAANPHLISARHRFLREQRSITVSN